MTADKKLEVRFPMQFGGGRGKLYYIWLPTECHQITGLKSITCFLRRIDDTKNLIGFVFPTAKLQ